MSQRFDFKGTNSEIEQNDLVITIHTISEEKARAVRVLIEERMVKRGLSLKGIEWGVGLEAGQPMPLRLDLRRLSRKKYPSVFYVFQRVRDSMPAWGADTVGLQDKLDIIAYLLKLNNYQPGPRELTSDVTRMKAMWLVEPGFTPLFNGVDMTGWKFNIGPNCRPQPVGCGKASPARLMALARAGAEKRPGETLLLALSIAEQQGAALALADRAAIVSALAAAGLTDEARAIAFEGVIALERA